MLRIVAIALLSFAAALITAAQEKTDASADKSMLLALESAWNQAEIHHDASAATAIIADTFISIDHHGVILNRSQYLAGLKDLSFKPE
jgi:Tfp pilus assembly protein PilV